MRYTDVEYRELSKYIKDNDFDKFLYNKTILITGSKGLVGTSLVKWILVQNEIKGTNTRIIGSTRNPLEIPDYITEGDNIMYCQYGTELNLKEHIDYIIHAASPTGNRYHMQHPVETFRTNVDGIEKMLDLAKLNEGVEMIYLSSEEVYGLPADNSPAMTEDMVGAIDSLNLRNCYPLGKKASEFLCHASTAEYGLNVKIIRPTVIHGLFQRYDEPRVVNELLRCIIEDKDFVMKSDGMTKKCMIYSLDAVTAIFTVLFKGTAGEAYNASNPETFITIKELANHLFEKFNPNIKIIFDHNNVKKSDGFLPHRTLVQDCCKLRALGWEPKKGLDEIYAIDIDRFKNTKRIKKTSL
ncbi:NAD(P)-dependent oxidoreductase [Enterocloster bolteae]|jgi:UDP-glucuronate decarboxylase|uniref:NAD-dependent epimerase/dehydratase family protein n=1 Tax=Clostridia TaxID=186801 RepID=UPI0011074DAD|nr:MULTISPECIES: NAD(P)-dependent oxidoreductase [Clostridia]MCB7093018.1 NAD(P)-dependent oxidoreductase [Enterocloster bolteae]MCH1938338.1 NAD(P)-dependent oxidoreductase [Enterocloster sp. OA11]